jgi:hypothetical protein
MTVVTLLMVVLALAGCASGGWVLTSAVLRLASRSPDAGSPGGDPAQHSARPAVSDGPDGAQARAVLRGGTWIGILERIAVTGLVLAGDTTSVALVIAVKGLGRYPELRENPGASERFVIGTLSSLIWAALVGAIGRLIVR